MSIAALTDEDIMPFGKHKGKRMADVPASYLAWLRGQNCENRAVMGYIENSWEAIKKECPDTIFDD